MAGEAFLTVPVGTRVAMVDEADFPALSQLAWRLHLGCKSSDCYYARTTRRLPGGKSESVFLHRLVMAAPPEMQVDHVNGDGLDCRRRNLRLATASENRRNQRKRAGCASRYKGATWAAHARKWRAWIWADGRSLHLGYFADELAAAEAYDRAARKHFGEFARPNFHTGGSNDGN